MVGRAKVIDGAHVEHRLREEEARIEHTEWADDARELFAQREAKRLEVGLPALLRDPTAHVRKEVAQRNSAIACRIIGVFLSEQGGTNPW